jgi:hypothetical protein
MDNVLDLKNPPEPEAMPEVSEIPEIPEIDMLIGPRAVDWKAHHPLAGKALRKHYILLGAIVAVGTLVAWWQASIAVLLVALAGAGALEARERWGRPVHVAIDEHGVSVDGHHMVHADFVSFDIHHMPDDTLEVSLQTSRWHLPHFHLPLGEQNPDEVHAVLMQYIPKGRHPLPLLDYFIRKP